MHIATRHYDDRHPVTHEWFDLQDRLYRKSNGEFALEIAGELPGDLPIVRSLGLSEVFEWLRECPWQVERAVVDGGSPMAVIR